MNQQQTPGGHRRRRPWIAIAATAAAVVAATAGAAVYRFAPGAEPATTGAGEPAGPPAASAGAPSVPVPAPPSMSLGPATTASASAGAKASASPSRSTARPAGGGGSCALPAYPTESCAGVPAGWAPKKTVEGDLKISKAGTTIENYLVKGSITVQADNVTIRNSRVYGQINNFVGDRIYGPLTMIGLEAVNPPGQEFTTNGEFAIGTADFTCRRCKVINRIEGFRAGGSSSAGAGPIVIEDSFVQLAVPPGLCASEDPHGDGVQGYGGPHITLRHNTIDQRQDDCPTAPIFIPDGQGNNGGVVDDNLLAGGGYALRLGGGQFSSVTGNKIVQGTAAYGPVEVTCSEIGEWGGNAVVTYDWATGRIKKETKKITECG
ncbi:hypothetical protein FHR83_001644 [Actinoplanes campanulatus]|uniref:Right handed beta helix region n=1 Tax=Actinoplanes campanulatus TaxID=113559 RepID=A0A7W5ADJ6_9ACTN|nr:hypothetical protein [Actinoplanes campanulatus]MBB3093995.1 hypothetical protein [Actinoplanes campanulatus]GGN33393.1 hypothetical protein GCM10010109_55340 [Actinoplanes campanulatus]GID38309.1 hypothetical protein Aca09nite_48150 [Actinoplanes campanulatus]